MAGKQRFTRRTASALADSAKDRAMIARRKTMAAVLGHKRHCPDCGKTARTADRVTACREKHKRDRPQKARTGPARGKTGPNRGNPTGSGWGKPKAPRRGHHSCGCGKTFRNDLELRDHARQHAEREDRTKKREQERGRRTEAVKTRDSRGGRPKGTPKQRTDRARDTRPRADRDAEWKAHRMQHAAGRVDREGNRTGRTESPRKVQPRTRVEPKVR